MNWSKYWDLATVPDELLWREVGRRRGSKREKKEVDPKHRRFLDRRATYMQILRAKKNQENKS